MSYTCQRLVFGSNEERVPGYEVDITMDNDPAEIQQHLIDSSYQSGGAERAIWHLKFSYELGKFYKAYDPVPGKENAIIKSWYAKGGGSGAYLTLHPFLIGEGEFPGEVDFVDFSEQPHTYNSMSTENTSVTATVHKTLHEYDKMEISTNFLGGVIINTITKTSVEFQQFFVIDGVVRPVRNTITVNRGQSCLALAVYKKKTQSSTSEHGPYQQYNNIPKTEWPKIIENIYKEIIIEGNGDIFQYVNPKLIIGSDPAIRKNAIDSISKRINELTKIKAVLSGTSGKVIKKL